MGLTEEQAYSSIRFSFSVLNTPEDVRLAVDRIVEAGKYPLMLDWFDLARQHVTDVIGIEDWMGLEYMYGPNYTWEGFQLMGFQVSMMRSGSDRTLPIMPFVTPSNDTNFLLKATSGLAQGAKHLFFWTYGPTCMSTENYWSVLSLDGLPSHEQAVEHPGLAVHR